MRGDETKFDNGKIMWDLLPYDAIEKIADILTYGHDKYTKDGWKSVPDAQDRYFAALMRHITAHRKGEKYDEESGRLHIAHAATNALFLLWLELQNSRTLKNDTPISNEESRKLRICKCGIREFVKEFGGLVRTNKAGDFICSMCAMKEK